jgi:hypothetical protein
VSAKFVRSVEAFGVRNYRRRGIEFYNC